MSDISSFAEWEAQHQYFDGGELALNERHQKLIDMASGYRIWADRDSSNDFRSSASDSDDKGENEVENGGLEPLVHNRGVGTVNGGLVGGVGRGLGMGKGLGNNWEIPSSTMEESQVLSQRLEEVEVSSAGQWVDG